MKTARFLVTPLLLLASVAYADSRMPQAPLANTQLRNGQQEAMARALMLTIRCLVCQGQSIADSDAELAGDMRSMIRTRIRQGEQPEAIRRWLIGRYGNWVSYDPPLGRTTALLWIAPVGLLAAGAMLARGRLRRRG